MYIHSAVLLGAGLRRVHFTACDVVCRKDIVAAYGEGSSRAAEHFPHHEIPRLGFSIRALQIDGGSEFKARFEVACEALGIPLFVLPPRSPKLNGHVERAHRTHQALGYLTPNEYLTRCQADHQ